MEAPLAPAYVQGLKYCPVKIGRVAGALPHVWVDDERLARRCQNTMGTVLACEGIDDWNRQLRGCEMMPPPSGDFDSPRQWGCGAGPFFKRLPSCIACHEDELKNATCTMPICMGLPPCVVESLQREYQQTAGGT